MKAGSLEKWTKHLGIPEDSKRSLCGLVLLRPIPQIA